MEFIFNNSKLQKKIIAAQFQLNTVFLKYVHFEKYG